MLSRVGSRVKPLYASLTCLSLTHVLVSVKFLKLFYSLIFILLSILCVAIDVIGCVSYAFPLVGEAFDLVWAPVAALGVYVSLSFAAHALHQLDDVSWQCRWWAMPSLDAVSHAEVSVTSYTVAGREYEVATTSRPVATVTVVLDTLHPSAFIYWSLLCFIEEIIPFTDALPSASLSMLYVVFPRVRRLINRILVTLSSFILFFLPIQWLMMIVAVACLSTTWALCVGSILFLFPRLLSHCVKFNPRAVPALRHRWAPALYHPISSYFATHVLRYFPISILRTVPLERDVAVGGKVTGGGVRKGLKPGFLLSNSKSTLSVMGSGSGAEQCGSPLVLAPSCLLAPSPSIVAVASHASNDSVAHTASNQIINIKKRKFLFCISPHGVYCFGLFSLVFRHVSGFDTLFPNVTGPPLFIGVANSLLAVPIISTIFSWWGFVPASKAVLASVAASGGDLAIIPGGIAEMMHYSNSEEIVFLRQRTGFIKLALEHGLSIVPVYTFNENKTFSRFEFWKYLRSRISRYFRISIQLFHGRWGSLVPFRHPLLVVVGAPIDVEVVANPLPDDIARVQTLYVDALRHLYDSTKTLAAYDHVPLKII